MTNNFDLIEEHLQFEGNYFYFVQILKRRKENPDMAKGQKLIRSFVIHNMKEYRQLQPKIEALCIENNARAYIRLNRRSLSKIALRTQMKIAQLILDNNLTAVQNAYVSCCGTYSSEPEKLWLIDIDTTDKSQVMTCVYRIIEIMQSANSNKQIIGCIPTKNGFHIITQGFDKRQWDLEHDIKKDAITLLFCA